jgi:heat shock protein HtpX
VLEQIESNRRRSALIVVAMGILLVAVGLSLGMYLTNDQGGATLGGAAALGVWLVMWLFARFQGDNALLQMAGAREIAKQDHPQLFNVVEEMTIAAGLPQMPRVFIVDDPAPNAFAVGRDPTKAAVAVTIGLLQLMNRDELQGVVAHEISHIKNRDVALMTTAGIMLGAIVMLADIGTRAMWWGGGARRSRDDNNQGGGQAILALVAIVLLIVSPILAQLIYFALSRRREYLADASGAAFTRWPEGLASALEKLGASQIAQADQSRVTAPMYIVQPLAPGQRRNLNVAFSTHPPLEERIRILRAMGKSADFVAYDRAYQQIAGGHVIGKRTLAQTKPVEAQLREPAAHDERVAAQPEARLREASNAYLSGSGYQFARCPNCQAMIKIPPARQGRLNRCPRCGGPLPTVPQSPV